MAERLDRSILDNKIAHLRLKHRGIDGSPPDVTKGSPFNLELVQWLKEQGLELDFERMALDAYASYYERHKAYQEIDRLESETGSLFEDEALISLSLDHPEHIEMGEANRQQWLRHSLVVTREFARQSNAFAKKSNFIASRAEAFLTDQEKLRDVEKRLQQPPDAGREAAD